MGTQQTERVGYEGFHFQGRWDADERAGWFAFQSDGSDGEATDGNDKDTLAALVGKLAWRYCGMVGDDVERAVQELSEGIRTAIAPLGDDD